MTTRRDFLWKTAASAGLLAGGFPAFSETKKTLLILGGTRFLGPEIVDAAKESGWTITLFNRGKTNPGLFPELEKLQGDRNGDLKSLEGRAWDAVVDTSGYFPRQVKDSATLLAPRVEAVRLHLLDLGVLPTSASPAWTRPGRSRSSRTQASKK